MKIGAIIQARMGSTRLSGKVMKELEGETVLSHVLERVKQSSKIDEIIIATTILDRDGIIVSEARRCGVKVYRGSEEDVLARYYYAAKENELDVVVRITSDCPVIDPKVIDKVISHYQANDYSIITNAGPNVEYRTYPRGLDVEVFSFEVLENAFSSASEKYQREHVTPFIYENAEKLGYYKNEKDYSLYRWTLDTEEDYALISEIYKHMYKGLHDFYMEDIIKLFEQQPELIKMNSHVVQKLISGD